MKLSIIIPWCDRSDLAHTINNFCVVSQEIDAQLIIVNYAGSSEEINRICENNKFPLIINFVEPTSFNKCKAQNLGAAAASGDLLFFCDCDITIDSANILTLKALVEAEVGCFGTVAGVRETVPNARGGGHVTRFGYHLQIATRNGRSLEIVDHEEDALDGTRQAPGLLMVRREDFEAIEGYNGSFAGWGWEDQDMIARLTLGAGLRRVQHGIFPHHSHDDAARTARYADTSRDRWESRDRIFRQALRNYDQNAFGGTYEHDRLLVDSCILSGQSQHRHG